MKRLLVCSEPDLPSVNMRSSLLEMAEWEDMGVVDGLRFESCGDDMIVTIPDMHIYHDGLDKVGEGLGFKPDVVIVMSKHSAASGEPALTVHPIGNYHENKFGGRERQLVRSSPAMMSDALRLISKKNDLEGFMVCFEVTHHGPWLEKPTFYIEIGSDGRNWGNADAARILAHTIMECRGDSGNPTLVGIGGGHYAPRFTEMALSHKADFGHMIPNYQLEGRDDEDVVRMVCDACAATDTNMVYIHRKSMKGPVARRLAELISSAGYEIVDSKDLEPINGNE